MISPNLAPKERNPRKNSEIRLSPVRVIDDEGNMLGEMPTAEALARAQAAGLDLVEVNPNDRPPLCKIVDYGKFLYQKQKKEKVKRAGSRKSDIKEVYIGFSTGDHDLAVGRAKAGKFLEKGHRVKVGLKMRGRENAHRKLAVEKLEAFIHSIPQGQQEGGIDSSGRILCALLKPNK